MIAILPAVIITSGFEAIRYALVIGQLVPFIGLAAIKVASLAVLNAPLYVLDSVRYLAKCMCFPCVQDDALVDAERGVGVNPSLSALGRSRSESEQEQLIIPDQAGHHDSLFKEELSLTNPKGDATPNKAPVLAYSPDAVD